MRTANTSILLMVFLAVAPNLINASIDDFIIKNEVDVRNLEAANDLAVGEDDADSYDDMGMMYDSCGGGMSADDYSAYSMDQLSGGDNLMDMPMLQMVLKQIREDPRYAELFKHRSSCGLGSNAEGYSEELTETEGISRSCNAIDFQSRNGLPMAVSEDVFNML